jgi:hypothetical protein
MQQQGRLSTKPAAKAGLAPRNPAMVNGPCRSRDKAKRRESIIKWPVAANNRLERREHCGKNQKITPPMTGMAMGGETAERFFIRLRIRRRR